MTAHTNVTKVGKCVVHARDNMHDYAVGLKISAVID